MSQTPSTPENELVERIVTNAFTLMQINRHRLATLEHLLMILLKDEGVQTVLKKCNADLDAMRQDIEEALSNQEKVPADIALTTNTTRVQSTPAFWRVVQATLQHHQSSGARELHPYHFLVPFFEEEDTTALAILYRQKLNRTDIIRVISHGNKAQNNNGKKEEDALTQYTINLNAKAAEGTLDPLVGREREIERLVQILGRRRKNNPLLVGDPGVGKTAIAEGLAQRIHLKQVPQRLLDLKVHTVNLGAVVAGTKYRGDFEERWKALLDQVSKDKNIILFIDEIHTIIGAGGGKGAMDAANLIKPALTTGDLRLIGSTTFEEYRDIFERDAALARRFQKVDVMEPTPTETIQILTGLLPQLEKHHQVKYSEKSVDAAVRLSVRYLPDKRLPDKAIDLLDEAASRLRSRQEPAENDIIQESDIESTLATMTQLPVERASNDDRESLFNLLPKLEAKVFGQSKATNTVAEAMFLSKAGLSHPNRPMGSFLFTGPTGVGKTETARQLADTLGLKLLRFDMSEYKEEHTIARLIGAPPGYVGHDKGGLLTEQVNQNPHAVLLLDEIEKAHPNIYNLLLQVMDAGRLTDTNGRTVDFRHVVLIMTTNAGASVAVKRGIGFLKQDRASDLTAALGEVFPPEFRNRLDAIVPFQALGQTEIEQVVRKFLGEMALQIAERQVRVEVSDEAVTWLAEKGFDPLMGARPLDRTIQEHIKKPLSSLILFGELKNGGLATVSLNETKTDLVLVATPIQDVSLSNLIEVVPDGENIKLAK